MNPNQKQNQNGFVVWTDDTISSATTGHRTFFHATPVKFAQFAPFQHFGTEEAAAARAKARPLLHHVTHEVWLAIRNPMPTFDDQAANHVGRLAEQAFRERRYDQARRDRIISRIEATQPYWNQSGDWNATKWRLSMFEFAEELSALNYDGLSYTNAVEGGLSYVPFRSNQIWWVTRETPES